MVEFASLLAAVSMFATSLAGLQARILQRVAGSDTVALQQAVLGARAFHVPVGGARAAYAHAPYHRPALRYVYATGWVAGTKHQTACALASLDPDGARSLVIKEIRKQPATMRQLRRLHLTAVQAGAAFTRGYVSACGG